ncbi:MAG: ABC transporter substrate-binding protein [Clostridia bacterium]|nr:ABC transporter substrate-binding protein [Clostridia bacterium]
MKKLAAILGAATLALLPLSGCGGDNLTKLKICEVTHSVFYAPLYLADSLGYFKEEGLKIQLTNGGGADSVMASVLSGNTDIGFCGPEAAIYVAIGDTKDQPTVFAQLTKRDGSFLVSRKEEPNFKWTDLKGKELLIGRRGGVPAMTFEYVLKENGFTSSEMNINYGVEFNFMTAAFAEGTGDYCTMFEPTASEFQASGKGYIVASVGEESGVVPYTGFIAKRSWLNKYDDRARGFVRAMLKAVEYTQTHEAAEIASHIMGHFPDASLESMTVSIANYKKIDSWFTDLAMPEESFTRLQDIIDSAGELSQRVEFSKVVDNKYVIEEYAKL